MLNIIFYPEIFILKNSDGLPIYFYRTLDQNFILNLIESPQKDTKQMES